MSKICVLLSVLDDLSTYIGAILHYDVKGQWVSFCRLVESSWYCAYIQKRLQNLSRSNYCTISNLCEIRMLIWYLNIPQNIQQIHWKHILNFVRQSSAFLNPRAVLFTFGSNLKVFKNSHAGIVSSDLSIQTERILHYDVGGLWAHLLKSDHKWNECCI